MIKNSTRYLKIILFLQVILYFIIEYNYDEELIMLVAALISLGIIFNSISFSKKEKVSIELGEKEDFRNSIWFVIFILTFLFVFIFYLVPKMNELNLFQDTVRESKISIPLLLFIPKFIELFMSIIFSEMKVKYYATEDGLLRSLEAEEEIKWEGFYNFKIVDSDNIIRFQKKNLKYFFIKYDEEYFNEYREEILSFLNKKLTRNE